jgi:hypothetical protein
MPNADTALCNPGMLGRVLYWVRTHAARGSDITMLSPEELRLIAMDLSLSETGLQSLSAGTRDNTVLMERMIRAHGRSARRSSGTISSSTAPPPD